MRTRRVILIVTVVLGLVCAPIFAGAQTAAQGEKKTPSQTAEKKAGASALTARDRAFVMEAADGGMAEVELGKLAAEKASSPEVKTFGQRMVDDHSKANEELMAVAKSKSIELPKAVSAKNKAVVDKLSKASGAEFDRMYMSHMVEDHTKDVAAFQRQAKSGVDPDVKGFAEKTLPTLQEHLKMAKSIAPKSTK